MEKEKRTEYPVNCIRVCLDLHEEEEYGGRLCGVALEQEVTFSNMNDFVIKVDEAFNQIGQPQSGQVLRKFTKNTDHVPYIGSPERYFESREIAQNRGKEKTIDLVMISRQCAEWQGMLMNVSGELIGRFASVLECIQLIDQYEG